MSKETETSKETEVPTKSTSTTVKSTSATAKSTTVSTVMYIGPTIPGVVSANTTFNNGLTDLLKNAIAEMPAINTLIVPIEKLVQARVQLRQENSPYDVCYNKVRQYVNKKGE